MLRFWKQSRHQKLARGLLIISGLSIILVLLFQTTVQATIIDGSSMLPGIQNGQRLIVIKDAYDFTSPRRGDIVIIHPPVAPGHQWIKRIIGLPGDIVGVKHGTVYVNNIPLKEPYIEAPPAYTLTPLKVPAGNYFVMGDNRNDSVDSHYGWTVPRENIVGEVWFRFWPFSSWSVVSGYPLTQEMQNPAQEQVGLLPNKG